jgi:hypothetical protein
VRRKKNWSLVPDGGLTPGQTGQLTVSCKITFTLTSKVHNTKIFIFKILDNVKTNREKIGDLKLAVVWHTTAQVTKLPF